MCSFEIIFILILRPLLWWFFELENSLYVVIHHSVIHSFVCYKDEFSVFSQILFRICENWSSQAWNCFTNVEHFILKHYRSPGLCTCIFYHRQGIFWSNFQLERESSGWSWRNTNSTCTEQDWSLGWFLYKEVRWLLLRGWW